MGRKPKRQPFERQEGETKKAFEAFVEYRNMGLDRSIAKVGEKLGKSVSLLERWSSKYDWVERAQSYDAEMDRKALIQEAKDRKQMMKRHANTAMAFQGKAIERLNSIKPEELSPAEVIKWYEIATKIERTARGEPVEIQELKHGGEVSQKHEHRVDKQIEEYTDIYYKLATQGDSTDEGGNEGNDS